MSIIKDKTKTVIQDIQSGFGYQQQSEDGDYFLIQIPPGKSTGIVHLVVASGSGTFKLQQRFITGSLVDAENGTIASGETLSYEIGENGEIWLNVSSASSLDFAVQTRWF